MASLGGSPQFAPVQREARLIAVYQSKTRVAPMRRRTGAARRARAPLCTHIDLHSQTSVIRRPLAGVIAVDGAWRPAAATGILDRAGACLNAPHRQNRVR